MAVWHQIAIRFFFLLLIIIGSCLTPALAQVTTTIIPGPSLGTQVQQDGSMHTIEGGTIRGPNQFHSFDRFDVGTGDTALFTGPSTVENILNRVTGGSTSMIDGTLQSDIPGANLYLLNPAGVVFGLDARLDITGSFHVSTADMLRLGEDGTFHVSPVEQSALSVAAPSAFGFLRDAPSGIRIEGSQLKVDPEQTLSVIGGNIDIAGAPRGRAATLAAPSGQLHLVSVASPGEAVLVSAAESDVTVESFARLGRLRLIDDALVNVSGNAGGTVRIRGAQLEVDDSRIRADTEGDMSGGLIDVQVEVLKISSGGRLSVNTRNGSTSPEDAGLVSIVATNRVNLSGNRSSIEALTRGSGHAGRVTIETQQLVVTDGGEVNTDTKASGNAGQITIQAGHIVMSGGRTRIRSTTNGSGDAGAIHIEAEYLQITNGSRILGNAFPDSTGNAGEVMIVVDTLIVEDAGRIVSGSSGPGEGGSIVIRASGRVLVSGRRSIISSSTGGSGHAGRMTIEAQQLVVTDGGEISTDTGAGGNAGQITLQGDEIAYCHRSQWGCRVNLEQSIAACTSTG